jgi:hypothetical protein
MGHSSGVILCALPLRRVRRARPPGRAASHQEGLLRRMGRSAAERVERGRLRGAGRELSGGHSLVARGGRRHAAGLEASRVAQGGGSFSAPLGLLGFKCSQHSPTTRPPVERTAEKAFLLSDRVLLSSAEAREEGIQGGSVEIGGISRLHVRSREGSY